MTLTEQANELLNTEVTQMIFGATDKQKQELEQRKILIEDALNTQTHKQEVLTQSILKGGH